MFKGSMLHLACSGSGARGRGGSVVRVGRVGWELATRYTPPPFGCLERLFGYVARVSLATADASLSRQLARALDLSPYVRIRPHTSAYVPIRPHT
jgi:hypothetical protein